MKKEEHTPAEPKGRPPLRPARPKATKTLYLVCCNSRVARARARETVLIVWQESLEEHLRQPKEDVVNAAAAAWKAFSAQHQRDDVLTCFIIPNVQEKRAIG